MESKNIIDEHLMECEACSSKVIKMQDNKNDEVFQDDVIERKKRQTNRLKKGYLGGLLGIMLSTVLICGIVNFAIGNTLDWFFIVLTSLMVFASLTVVPLIALERKLLWTIGSFTTSLIILLLTCCLYTNGDWFIVASVSTLFGLSIIFLPLVMDQLHIRGVVSQHKGLVVMTIDTILLYCLIISCGLYGGSVDYWRPALLMTTVNVLFPWTLFVIIRYTKVNGFIKAGICVIISGFFTSFINNIIEWILNGLLNIRFVDANLLVWNSDTMINANVDLLMLIIGSVIGMILLILGIIKKIKQN